MDNALDGSVHIGGPLHTDLQIRFVMIVHVSKQSRITKLGAAFHKSANTIQRHNIKSGTLHPGMFAKHVHGPDDIPPAVQSAPF